MNNLATNTASFDADRWLSEPQLQVYLNFSKSTVRRLRQKGLPCLGRDRLRRYHLSTVLQWLLKHT